MSKSIIKKGVVRKIKTADFEQLDVFVEVEEQIVWETEDDRKEATRKITERLKEDITDTYNNIVEKFGVDRCIGVVNSKVNKNKSYCPI